MTPEPPTYDQLLIILGRVERGVALPAETAQLRPAVRALHDRAYPIKEQAA